MQQAQVGRWHAEPMTETMPGNDCDNSPSCTGLGRLPALSEEASSGSGRSGDTIQTDIASLQHYKNRTGPELRLMRQAQGRNRCKDGRPSQHLHTSAFAGVYPHLHSVLLCPKLSMPVQKHHDV